MKSMTLYALCPACEGHGWVRAEIQGQRTELCIACLGKGSKVTADGRSIIGLLGVAGLAELLPDS